MTKIRRFLGMVLGLCLCFSTFASAHTMWLNVTDYSPDIHASGYGARTIVYFGWGHGYPVADFLTDEFLGEFFLIDPDGREQELVPNPGGFRATDIKMETAGGWIVTATTKAGFYTMYVEKGKVHHEIGPKTGLEGVILSYHYQQFSKALIKVGEVKDDSLLKPVGHKLEIIPLKNPYGLKEGDFLPLQVLLEGKPARYCKVFATYSGFSTKDDFAYATYTDGKGTARIRILHYGPWLIKADIKSPASEELKDKCNELHYTATLTFEVP